jgi:hypothetical protein
LGDTNSKEYVEEASWREVNPPDPREKGCRFFPPVTSNELLSLKPAPCLPNLPDTGKWSFDHESRVLLCNFRNSAVSIDQEDRTFLLQMIEHDDITVVSEGLADDLNPEFWNLSSLEDRVGNEYYYSIRKFRRKVKKVAIACKDKIKNPLVVPDEMKNDAINNMQPQCEGKVEKASSKCVQQYVVTHEEVDGNLSMQVKDYVRYLEQRRTALNRICQSRKKLGLDPINPLSLTDRDGRANVDDDGIDQDNFEHFEYQDVETKFHKLNVVDDVLYLYDFDMDKLMPALCDDFTTNFKLPEFLPGGAQCMMNSVR